MSNPNSPANAMGEPKLICQRCASAIVQDESFSLFGERALHGNTSICCKNLQAQLAAKDAEIAGLKAEKAQCYRYASQLFTALHPECTLTDDTFGVLMQIDNATVGYQKTIARLQAQVAGLREELDGECDCSFLVNCKRCASTYRTSPHIPMVCTFCDSADIQFDKEICEPHKILAATPAESLAKLLEPWRACVMAADGMAEHDDCGCRLCLGVRSVYQAARAKVDGQMEVPREK